MTRQPPITDSPWLWVLVYSFVPLVLLALISIVTQQYGKRQSRLERQYQARTRTAGDRTQAALPMDGAQSADVPPLDQASRGPAGGRPYSSADDTLISLVPLLVLFMAISCFAAVMLVREQRRWSRRYMPAAAGPQELSG
jgi:hypothetical protein